MTEACNIGDAMPVVRDLKAFNQSSGNVLERFYFNHRKFVLALFAFITLVLSVFALRMEMNAAFERMIPHHHPFIQNYFDNKGDLRGLGNSLRVVVENTQGDIFDPEYLDVLRKVNDELFLMPGVDRAWVKSLWSPAVRWTEVTEEGFSGGAVMPPNYDGSPRAIEALKDNLARSGIIGNLVANDLRSSMIFVPLLDGGLDAGEQIDYLTLSRILEESIRDKYELSENIETSVRIQETDKIKIHVVGFAKLVGDLIEGIFQVMVYFGVAVAIAAANIYYATRCIRSTALVISCSLIAVVWQLGIVSALGMQVDPYSVLVPFLVFAIGVSHGAQKMNGIMQDIGRGTHKLVAARYTFRRLFLAGLTALIADAVGFGVLMVIDIPVIKELAISAAVGVWGLGWTNLVLLPVLLSYTGVSEKAARRTLKEEGKVSRSRGLGFIWEFLNRFTERRWATGALLVAAGLMVVALTISQWLQIGDLEPGAPELRQTSRYNQDNAYITSHYSLSSDQFAVIVKTPVEGCLTYKALTLADQLEWTLQQVEGVQATIALPDAIRQITAGTFDGNPKWASLIHSQEILNYGAQQASVNNRDLFNTNCSVMPVVAFLADHKADTLDRVVKAASAFAREHSDSDVQFLLAAGTAGIEAATNEVVRDANHTMLIYVYLAVIVLCLVTFRSWRAVVVAVVPLIITSILCEALMVILGIGVKVATLPVIALGVGIGVDYALYLLSVQLQRQREGYSLAASYRHSIHFVGKVVGMVGITLGIGVVTWVMSPIKFQADMGILLTFMFLWNMVGALVLIPALSHFLLNGVDRSSGRRIGDESRGVIL
ncbi:efflux RND transporter permease subunit [Zobellella sp. An-6]|uniref:efflux RND transporter permease subunit n=1 Tax=Zobellella sp. An-6 TaxID=3400218 RepID=UPI0040413613